MKNIINKLKFARAGPGHKLNEERPQISNQPKPESTSYRNEKPLHSQVQAGSAALARFEKDQAKNKTVSKKVFRSSSKSDEISNQQSSSSEASNIKAENQEVFFVSPFNGRKIREENYEKHLKKHLIKLFETDQSAAACSMIKNLNSDDVIESGTRIIFKYIDNIIANPNEVKYQKIRKNNRIYREKVEGLFGSEYFFLAAGFKTELVQVEEIEEEYFVLKKVDVEGLQSLKNQLEKEERMKKKLSRHPQVLTTKIQLDKDDIQDEDFFKLSAKELKKIQIERSQQLELSKQLRTQKMRDASLKPTTNHKFTIIKVRFPSGKVLQGTFYSTETIEDLKMFVWEHITNEAGVFQLLFQNKQLIEDQMTLHAAGMVPAVLVHLRWNEEIHEKLNQAGIRLDLKS